MFSNFRFTARLVNSIPKSTSVAYDIGASFAVRVVVIADFDHFGDRSIGSFRDFVNVAVVVVMVVAIVTSREYLQINWCILLLWLHLKLELFGI